MSFFSGGGGQTSWPTDYLPGQSPQEKAVRQSGEQANAMIEQMKLQTAANEAQAEEIQMKADAEQAKADKLAADDESMRLQRIRSGGTSRLMTAGYGGYGDTRTLGQAQRLGG